MQTSITDFVIVVTTPQSSPTLWCEHDRMALLSYLSRWFFLTIVLFVGSHQVFANFSLEFYNEYQCLCVKVHAASGLKSLTSDIKVDPY